MTWTIYLRGVLQLQPQSSNLSGVLQEFANDPDVEVAIKEAVSSLMNVSIETLELNITAPNSRRLQSGSAEDSVQVDYVTSRSFPSLNVATDWVEDRRSVSLEDMSQAINENLADTRFTVQVLNFGLEIQGLPAPAESTTWIVVLAVLGGLGALSCMSLLLCAARGKSPNTEMDTKEVETEVGQDNKASVFGQEKIVASDAPSDAAEPWSGWPGFNSLRSLRTFGCFYWCLLVLCRSVRITKLLGARMQPVRMFRQTIPISWKEILKRRRMPLVRVSWSFHDICGLKMRLQLR